MVLIKERKHMRKDSEHSGDEGTGGELSFAYLESPIGLIQISGTQEEILSLTFMDRRLHEPSPGRAVDEALRQVEEYFRGDRRMFDVPMAPEGTDFQKSVWDQLTRIPFGRTASYKDIAERIGRPRAVRAVGGANGRNPIPIIVPCHRVIGSDGSMTGFGSGIWRKEWLLRHEGVL
jgi:methylated-DNA-[protein]-cysteine S-methyltransferase